MSGAKTVIDLAIIIPTLNEEHFIGRLLDSIINQSVAPRELMVVDAFSKDKTIGEIKKRQKKLSILHWFRIPKSTISRQRNLGVKKTTSSHLLFLDADMELRGKETLAKYFQEILENKPDIASATTLPDSSYWKDSIYFQAEDLLLKVFKYIWPIMLTRNLYVRRQVFEKVGGFDEQISVGEDRQLANEITKGGGKLIFIKSVKLHTSTRRVAREGRRRYALRMFLFGLNLMLFGHKKTKVKYEFGNFKRLS